MQWQWRQSPVTRVLFRGQRVHVKRDDVFHLAGNKCMFQMRKMYYFVKQSDEFFANTHLFSFGGSQSNAMLALAQLANARHVPFTYFSRELSFKDDMKPVEGNLALAKTLGMRHVQLQPDVYHELIRPPSSFKSLYVPQGAAFPEAQDGVKLLAEEINEYVQTQWPDKQFSVVLPCGTGTTALYLAQHLNPQIKLYAVPCVGDAEYLQQQFQQLIDEDPMLKPHTALLPRVLIPKRKSRFGRLWWPQFDMYQEVLQETKVDFDLVYGAFAWHTLFSDERVLNEVLGRNSTADIVPYHGKTTQLDATERELMYIHTGGTSGNATMLERYRRKNRQV
ncbi:hypothetical protein P3T76_011279 [Phytophthora citrophthora]|uniref:Tryptophan synthase beta chain-like PALP domain-containing protein n=1 Tax=Phytophthora citrophthora TaxID=4793 RepID=A0AAD9LFG7_9STRA|nr:hypothetical protein P3T76_011279 [Phytophthora citrophthora]